jgi:hypothetical protein
MMPHSSQPSPARPSTAQHSAVRFGSVSKGLLLLLLLLLPHYIAAHSHTRPVSPSYLPASNTDRLAYLLYHLDIDMIASSAPVPAPAATASAKSKSKSKSTSKSKASRTQPAPTPVSNVATIAVEGSYLGDFVKVESAAPATPTKKASKARAGRAAAAPVVTPERPTSRAAKAVTAGTSSTTTGSGSGSGTGLSGAVADLNVVTPTTSSKRANTPSRSRVDDLDEPVSSLKKEFDEASRPHIVSPVRMSKLVIGKNVETAYKIVRKATGALGGNGHTGQS